MVANCTSLEVHITERPYEECNLLEEDYYNDAKAGKNGGCTWEADYRDSAKGEPSGCLWKEDHHDSARTEESSGSP